MSRTRSERRHRQDSETHTASRELRLASSGTDPGRRDEDEAQSRLARIERRAYEIYQARGGTGGRELEDWLQAEREVDAAPKDTRDDAEIIRDV